MPLRLALLLGLACPAAASGGQNEEETLVIFIFFGISIGALVTFALSRTKLDLPYTVVIFILGFAIGEIGHYDDNVSYSRSIQSWQQIKPDLIFYCFLPLLIFGDAQSLNWHHLKASLGQSLLLAGPGVLIGAFMTGIFMYFSFPFGWSWFMCMLFGSILSATDPVAVVSLMKNAGAPSSLTILIVGESLLNDGVAIVLYKLYHSMMRGSSLDGSEVIAYFFKMCIGSPLFGMAGGFIGVYCLSKASTPSSKDDVTIQVAVSLCCAYLVFFFAEYELKLSGVLATVGAGVAFCWMSPTAIIQHETMDHIWSFAEWMGNTLIFLLAGLLIATIRIVERSDWAYLVAIYVFLMALRVLIVCILYPLLSRFGLPVDAKGAAFLSFAGLRGALGITLALIVLSEHEELGIERSEADRFFFFVAGIAALTLILNATTADRVLKYLGLLTDYSSATKHITMNQVCNRMRTQIIKEVEASVKQRHFDTGIHWSDLIPYNTLLQNHEDEIVPTVEEVELAAVEHAIEPSPVGSGKTDEERVRRRWKDAIKREISLFEHRRLEQQRALRDKCLTGQDMLTHCRTMFFSLLRVQYWEFITNGKLPRNNAFSTQVLLYSVDVGLDHVDEPEGLGDWSYIKSQALFTRKYDMDAIFSWIIGYFGSYLPKVTLKYLQRQSVRILHHKVQILLSFIDGHENAQSKFDAFLRPNGPSCPEGLTREMHAVLKESKGAVADARHILNKLNHMDVITIATIQTGYQLLIRQMKLIEKMVEEGFVDAKMAEVFYGVINHDIERLHVLKHERERLELMKKRAKKTIASHRRNSEDVESAHEHHIDDGGIIRDRERTLTGNINFAMGQQLDSEHGSSDGVGSSNPDTTGSVHVDKRHSDSRIELSKFKEAILSIKESHQEYNETPISEK